jgi:hypothetical protein
VVSFGLTGDESLNEFWKYREMLRSVDEFNRDIKGAGPGSMAAIDDATGRLLRSNSPKMPDRWLHLGASPEFERLAKIRCATSELAKSLDRTLRSYHRTLFFWLFLALVLFHAYAHDVIEGERPTHQPYWLGLFLLTLALMSILVAKVWYQRLDDRRLDYRALSEALRVRYFWALAGLTKSVAANYLGHLEGEMSWARRALYAIAPPPPFWKTWHAKRSPGEQAKCLYAVKEQWVTDQKNYYRREHRRAHNRSRVLHAIGLGLALAGWGLSASLFVFGSPLGREFAPLKALAAGSVLSGFAWPDAGHPDHLVLIFSSLLVIGGGLMIAYCERRGYDALARQYGNIHTVFERGERELTALLKAYEWGRARQLIEALGNEALVEHVQWLLLHRVHPFEMIIEG